MRGVNKVIILGNLGKDPEIRHMPNGKAVASFSIATSEKYLDKSTGEQVEKTEWHNCTAFDKLAEIIGKYLHKGSKVYVEGKLKTDKYQDKSGKDCYATKIIVNSMQMLDGKNGNAGATDDATSTYPSATEKPSRKTVPGYGDADFDDDIPF